MHAQERAIGEIAGRQDNVITREQLVALGIGRGAIAHRLTDGLLQRMHQGVYLIGPAAPTVIARARAASLACGDGAVISHRTAAELWELAPQAGGDAHVTVAGRNPGRRPGICLHRVIALARFEMVSRQRLTVTSPARTICDLAGTESIWATEEALSEARTRGLVTDRQLLSVIERAPTRRGSAVIRALLRSEAESGYTRSAAERRMRKLLRAAQLSLPRLNVPLLGYVADFLWPREKLIVEVDGYKFHGSRGKFESDRKRDLVLTAAGYRVVRVTWRQMRDEALFVVARIAQALVIVPATDADRGP
jgi:very-short-patch-repair endonuclease